MKNRQIMYQGAIVAVEAVTLDSGRVYELVRTANVSAVVALRTSQGSEEVLGVSQHRLPAGGSLWEIPAGRIDSGETPLSCAQRELAEETGYAADTWDALGGFYSTPGFSTEYIYVFLARDVYRVPEPPNGDETELHVAWLDTSAVETPDAKTLAALFMAQQAGFL